MVNNTEITISDSARNRIAKLQQIPRNKDKHLRLVVHSGGCNGFRYEFLLDDKIDEKADLKIENNGQIIATIDEMSLSLLKGSQIDFIEDFGASFFKVTNPNASSSCGCGDSFSV